MNLQEFTLLFMAVLASGSGQFFLKSGALKLGKVTANNVVSHLLSIAINPELLAGFFCYGLGAMLYILVLTRVKLSVAAPAASITYIFSVLIGYFAFQEALSINRLVGLGFIVCGVVLVAWQQ
ncbi:MAG: EamA family transporter [Leptolyngbya sp. SIO1D8]|nr:EamA family transporter [Leptolyngbya sp. SIO1D8]